jgi:hypothetical protein
MPGTQEVYLGSTLDNCGGQLSMKDRAGKWVRIPRGSKTSVDVAIDGGGYWRWRCGVTKERSRGGPNHRRRVKRLKVYRSEESWRIRFSCYDLL